MSQTGKYRYLPYLCLLIKTWLILSSQVEKFNHFWMQHIDHIEQLFMHQCIWCEGTWLMTVFQPSRTCTHITNFWRQAAFGNFSCYDKFFCFKFFLMFLFNIFFSCTRFPFFTIKPHWPGPNKLQWPSWNMECPSTKNKNCIFLK